MNSAVFRTYADVVRLGSPRHTDSAKTGSLGRETVFSGCHVAAVQGDIARRFPLPSLSSLRKVEEPFWFSNEYPEDCFSKKLDLREIIKLLPGLADKKTGRSAAMVTGEGGLFSSLPELAQMCDLVIQIDCNPAVLHLSRLLFHCIRTCDDEESLLKSALGLFEKEVGWFVGAEVERLKGQFQKNREHMRPLHCLSSEKRLAEFREAQELPIQFVNANYFKRRDMLDLSRILSGQGFSITYINLSNIAEYFQEFYRLNSFGGRVAGIDPSIYVRLLPISADALCACSSLFGLEFKNYTCCRDQLGHLLYGIAKKRGDRIVKSMARVLGDNLCTEMPPYSPAAVCHFLASALSANEGVLGLLRLALSRLDKKGAEELEKIRTLIFDLITENRCDNHRRRKHAKEFMYILNSALLRCPAPHQREGERYTKRRY